ncbi:MAG: CHASE2 domain-containing protein, partial [Gammaproteobacteria bacterium]|nr:CHASE2 domain-containing protein [Gammaproteobacteria bacterium]
MNSLFAKQLPTLFSLLTLLLLISALFLAPNSIALLRNASLDTLQRLSPRQVETPAPIQVITIDEESLRSQGQWPWPRSTIAAIVNRLTAMGAAIIAFDMVFPERDRTAPDAIFR